MNKDQDDKQKKDEVLRAKDIIPPYSRKILQEQNNPLKNELTQDNNVNKEYAETFSSNQEEPARLKSEIPQFDLAGQILSEQRKIASVKRQKSVPKQEKVNLRQKTILTDSIFKPPTMLSQQGKIIAEIVARDIRKLRKNNI